MPGANESADPSTDRTRTTVTINVLDLNDEKPVFSVTQVEGSIKEELPAGNIVTLAQELRVTDPDQVRKRTGNYSLIVALLLNSHI